MPKSETHGLGRLELQGHIFGNVPPTPSGYVNRAALQKELQDSLLDDRHPIVTLVGRGGIGKTALALSVLPEVESRERFGAAIWLSARDIDLLPEAPKLVSAHILSQRDIANEFVRLMQPSNATAKGFKPVSYFSDALTNNPVGFPLLFEAVMLRPANERMDVENAIDELIRSSFIETIATQEQGESVLSVPLAAAVFGQKKLRASPLTTAVQANTALLLNFGAGQKSGTIPSISWRIERFFRSVAEKAANDPLAIEAHLPMMEFLAQRHPRGWLLPSRIYEESTLQNSPENAKAYLRRYLEDVEDPEESRAAWSQLSRLCRSTQDWIGEIHATVELCSLPGTNIKEISNGLNRWNSLFKQQALSIAGDERQILGKRLLQLFESDSANANATDLSRAAWIYMALHEEVRAAELVRQGLKADPGNEYCQNLAVKLMIQEDLPC